MDPNNFHSTLTLKKDKNMNSTFWLLTHYGFAEFSFVEEEVYLFIYLFICNFTNYFEDTLPDEYVTKQMFTSRFCFFFFCPIET